MRFASLGSGSEGNGLLIEAGATRVLVDCGFGVRDTVARLRDSPEWRLEVADKAGTIRHLFRLTAETFDQ